MDEYRYRNKDGKIQVQKFENNKWKSRTLPPPKDTWLWLCPGQMSDLSHKNGQFNNQKFVESLLNEHHKSDTNPIEKLLSEVIPPKKEGLPDD